MRCAAADIREIVAVMTVQIRRVRAEDWAALRDVRLAALADQPDAFASTLADESGYDERRWQDWIARTAFFLAWDGGRPGGVIGAFGQEDGGWHVISMWVSPHLRGSGLAGRLVDAVAGHAREQRAPSLTLWVTDGNDRARVFYQRAGFHSTGTRQPVPHRTEPGPGPGPEQWEEEMILELDGAARKGT